MGQVWPTGPKWGCKPFKLDVVVRWILLVNFGWGTSLRGKAERQAGASLIRPIDIITPSIPTSGTSPNPPSTPSESSPHSGLRSQVSETHPRLHHLRSGLLLWCPVCPQRADRLSRLQYVHNSAARVLTRTQPWQHITPMLPQLHWLPVKSRFTCKILLLTYKSIHGLPLQYLTDLLQPLHSDTLCGPLTRTCWPSPTVDCGPLETGHHLSMLPHYGTADHSSPALRYKNQS